MAKQEGKVVVIVTLDTEYIEDMGAWEAHMPDLAITSYAHTEDDAMKATKDLFGYTVRAHRRMGSLSEWLDACKVQWVWEPHYKGEKEPEDVSVEDVPLPKFHSHSSKSIEIPDDAYGLAA